MAIQKIHILRPKITSLEPNPRLDNFLAQELPNHLQMPISKSRVRALIIAGAVHLNGKRVRIASKEIFGGSRIDVYLDLKKLNSVSKEHEALIEINDSNVLYEDDYIIVLNKPAGLATQPTLDKARNNLFEATKRYLKSRNNGEPYLGLHHRLDRDTSGVIMMTKSREANSPVALMFKEHTIQKYYIAKVENKNKLKEDWIVEDHLKRDPNSKNKQAKFISTSSGGDYAKTEFKILDPERGMIEAKPITGRTHQIRVHLSESGFPIIGDWLYGAKTGLDHRFLLHAFRVEFAHPITGEKMRIEAPLPEELSI